MTPSPMKRPAQKNPARQFHASPIVPAISGATKCAEVDAHVEDRETGVAPRAGLTFVEHADDRGNIRLQQPDADDDDREAEIEHRRCRGYRENEVAEHDDHAAPEHGVALPDQPVGDPPSRQGAEKHRSRVQPVHGAGRDAIDAEAGIRAVSRGDEKQHEQRSHSVVGEALEELGHEQRREAARMAKELA